MPLYLSLTSNKQDFNIELLLLLLLEYIELKMKLFLSWHSDSHNY